MEEDKNIDGAKIENFDIVALCNIHDKLTDRKVLGTITPEEEVEL